MCILYYCFYKGHDVFISFLLFSPYSGWIDAAHRNGVKILGTIITEHLVVFSFAGVNNITLI